ncbi:arylsulfatase B-like [Amblyomma americanum]
MFSVAIFLSTLQVVLRTKAQPDILFMLADDMGWDDVSFHGSSQIPTPNLDALAADGVILNAFYALPTCTPSRAAFMTGRYPIRMGIQGYPINNGEPRSLPLDMPILPQYLKELGYETNLVGKWHLGSYTKAATPTYRGFDTFYGYYYGEEDYYSHTYTHENHTGLDFWTGTEPNLADSGVYSTNLYTRRAQELIRNRQKDKPMFLLLSYQAAHGTGGPDPLQAPKENIDKFSYIEEEERRCYAGMVDALDQSVGDVYQTLSEEGMLDNVVVIFVNDNGGTPFGDHSSRSFNWPLRGTKWSVWEGSTRVPAFVWSPLLAKRRRVSHQLMHIADWFTTLYKLAGGDVANLGEVDGVDMWRHLSRGGHSPRTDMLYNIDPMEPDSLVAGIRDSRYKLVMDKSGINNGRYRTPGGHHPVKDLDELFVHSTAAAVLGNLYKTDHLKFPWGWRQRATLTCGQRARNNFSPNDTEFLFDIVKDPCELNNLASFLPEVVSALKKRLDVYRAVAKPSLLYPRDPASFPENHNGTWAPWVESS